MDDKSQHGVIVERLDGLRQLMDQKFSGQHEIMQSLHRKVDHTNGRVMKLEKWRAYLAGAVAILMTLIVPILFMVLTRLIDKL